VGSGGKTDDNDSGPRVTESWHRFTPIVIRSEGSALRFGNLLAPRHEAGTESTLDKIGLKGA
jgi:hypothetical protein